MLVFLKLGGSLITDKTRPYRARQEQLEALSRELASALREQDGLQLLLGHGSGSFGHQAASRFGTRQGVSGREAWRGFAEVWYQASRLNRLVVESLRAAGLPAITLSPLAGARAQDSRVARWDLASLGSCLSAGLLPVVHGDVVFDDLLGGTVLSTEDLFVHLARQLHPQRILLAGQEPGVWEDYPTRSRLLGEIRPGGFAPPASGLEGAAGADVTGGMRSKVTQMLSLVEELDGLEVLIFSAEAPGTLSQALSGGNPGTRLHR